MGPVLRREWGESGEPDVRHVVADNILRLHPSDYFSGRAFRMAPLSMGVFTDLLAAVLIRIHSALTAVILYLLALGPIPRHVGFVMDGNRRYARQRGLHVSAGHTDGFGSLRRVLEVCLKLRIRAVSIYAFAIDNFNRSDDEVNALMGLLKSKLTELCRHGDLLQEYGIRVRFVGRTDMFPEDVKQAIRLMETTTASNTQGVLNVCCPYSSRDEIVSAVQESLESYTEKETLNAQTVFSNLGTCRSVTELSECRPPLHLQTEEGKLDILVRTSNVKRMSDFMLWQASSDTQIHFIKTYWPEFGLSDMLPILLGWQQKTWMKRLRL